LQDVGARFQQLLDQTRQELAQEYLQQHSLGLVDIAFLLGYQDQSAFSHAFKEWTGMSPGSYRERCGKA
jgi:AraC-like DNA-binding protein